MTFRIEPFPELPEVKRIASPIHRDHRGSFAENLRASRLAALGIEPVVQVADSRSGPGVVRGLHFQAPPAAQGKLVWAMRGSCYDVAVDVRRGSPTFGHHVAATLSADEHVGLWIPPGFAHGFCALADGVDLLYLMTHHEADPQHARTVRWDDPALAISWPTRAPVLSQGDASARPLRDVDTGFL